MRPVTKVFIVDDSAVVRTTLSALLQNEKDIEPAGTAADPLLAEGKFSRQGWPDVIILDIEMPRMDGLTFLKKIMKEHPTPVIICSSVAQQGSRNALEALALGAVEVIPKPEAAFGNFINESREWMLHAIRAAAASGRKKTSVPVQLPIRDGKSGRADADAMLPLKPNLSHAAAHDIVAVGASTGGVQVLEKILTALPEKSPPILIAQHMPPGFTRTLAERLDRICAVTIKEAADGDRLLAGRVLIAPGDYHMTIRRLGNSYAVVIKDGPKVNQHRPSIDVLFRSCANEAGANALGFLLTGMGDDGAKGLLEMRERGARTYSQDEASCIVYGMPQAAVLLGASTAEVSPEEVAQIIKRREQCTQKH